VANVKGCSGKMGGRMLKLHAINLAITGWP
jgi:hypothetical protein